LKSDARPKSVSRSARMVRPGGVENITGGREWGRKRIWVYKRQGPPKQKITRKKKDNKKKLYTLRSLLRYNMMSKAENTVSCALIMGAQTRVSPRTHQQQKTMKKERVTALKKKPGGNQKGRDGGKPPSAMEKHASNSYCPSGGKPVSVVETKSGKGAKSKG